jgi:SAM-dependent methyltransferase
MISYEIRAMRGKLASNGVLKSTWHLALGLRGELQELLTRPLTQDKYAEDYAALTDPWGYGVHPFAFEKFQAATELLDGVRNGARFERGWEIGCSEGIMTMRLGQMCEQLSAVDFIPLALERARLRCLQFSNISFSKWDLKSDPAPGLFDLIVITDVLGSFTRPVDVRRACEKVVTALAPGGYLLYGDFLGNLYRRRIHESCWGRFLLRGAPNIIHWFVAAHPALVETARRETSMHLLALFRNSK